MTQQYILLLFLLIFCTHTKIVYLQELYRHGARYTTSQIYDGKQTKNMSGALTAVGMRQQYLLGSFLRQDYQQALGLSPEFDPSQVQVIGDSHSLRCMESAYAHMAGWFGLGWGQVLPDGLSKQFLQPPFQSLSQLQQQADIDSDFALEGGYQPIPIRPWQQIYPSCPLLDQIIVQRVEAAAAKIAILQQEQTLFANKMRKIFDIPLLYDNLAGLVELYDVVVADRNLGRKIPPEFTEEDFQRLKYVQNYFLILIYTDHLAKVVATPIIKAVVDNMEKLIEGKLGQRKLTVYSGHDTDVAPMLSFLNLSSAECVQKKYRNQSVSGSCGQPVPFASSIQFELHTRQTQEDRVIDGVSAGNYYVRVKYNGQYYQLCQSSKTECDFADFAARVRGSLIDYIKECGVK